MALGRHQTDPAIWTQTKKTWEYVEAKTKNKKNVDIAIAMHYPKPITV